jgi:hypothetical protein
LEENIAALAELETLRIGAVGKAKFVVSRRRVGALVQNGLEGRGTGKERDEDQHFVVARISTQKVPTAKESRGGTPSSGIGRKAGQLENDMLETTNTNIISGSTVPTRKTESCYQGQLNP